MMLPRCSLTARFSPGVSSNANAGGIARGSREGKRRAGAGARHSACIEIEIAGAKDTLATKHDLAQLESKLHVEMGQLGSQLRVEIAKVGADLHAEIHRAVSGSTRQMYMALLGHLAMTRYFICFLVALLR